jgi:hypothetical protein
MRVVVDQIHLDLPAVTGVDRTRCVEHGDAEPVGQTGTRVDETHVPGWERDRDPGRHQGARAGRQPHVDGRTEVGARVAVVRVGRDR